LLSIVSGDRERDSSPHPRSWERPVLEIRFGNEVDTLWRNEINQMFSANTWLNRYSAESGMLKKGKIWTQDKDALALDL